MESMIYLTKILSTTEILSGWTYLSEQDLKFFKDSYEVIPTVFFMVVGANSISSDSIFPPFLSVSLMVHGGILLIIFILSRLTPQEKSQEDKIFLYCGWLGFKVNTFKTSILGQKVEDASKTGVFIWRTFMICNYFVSIQHFWLSSIFLSIQKEWWVFRLLCWTTF